jgi:spermidine synthase
MRRCLILFGTTCMLGQLLALRELSVTFHGGEWVTGIVLAIWLLLVAAGCGFAGKLVAHVRLGTHAFATILASCGLLVPITLLLIRVSRWAIGGELGSVPSLGMLVLASLLSLMPLCIAVGFFLAIAWTMVDDAAHVYVFNLMGLVIGGAAFTFFFASSLSAFTLSLMLAAINCAAAFSLWYHSRKGRLPWGYAFLPVIAGLLFLALTPMGKIIAFASQSTRFPGRTLRSSQETPYGRLDVTVREGEISFYQSGVRLAASTSGTTVLPPLLSHGRPEKALLIGGSATDALGQALLWPGLEVDCVEPDPDLFAISRPFLSLAQVEAIDGSRTTLIRDKDPRAYLKTVSAKYDVIFSIAPKPTTGLLNRLFTQEFFAQVRHVLKPGGIFGLKISCAPNAMSDPDLALAATVDLTLAQVFDRVVALPSHDGIYFLATGNNGLLPPTTGMWRLSLRANKLRINQRTGQRLTALLETHRRARLIEMLDETPDIGVNTDSHPFAYDHSLRIRIDGCGGRARSMWQWMRGLRLPDILIGFLLLMTAVAIAQRAFGRPLLIGLGAGRAASGMAGLVLGLVLLFAFQSFHGQAYSWMGVIFAAFMAGCAGGGAIYGKLIRVANPIGLLMVLQAALATLAGVIVVALGPLSSASAPVVCAIIPLLNICVGLIVGAQYPLAVQALGGRSPFAATGIYAMELVGAGAGAALGAMILIPVIGFEYTAWAMSMLCLATLPILWLSHETGPGLPGE